MEKNLENTSKIIRTGRKLMGLTQVELAAKLNFVQGTVSKYESGTLMPGLEEWFRFCNFIRLDIHEAFEQGVIDGNPEQDFSKHKFSISKKYKSEQLLFVREITPLLSLANQQLGKEGVATFFKNINFDQDYLNVMNAPLSINLFTDLYQLLVSLGVRDLDNKIFTKTLDFANHGRFGADYKKFENKLQLIQKIIDNQSSYNTILKFQSKSQRNIKFQTNANIPSTVIDNGFSDFFSAYKLKNIIFLYDQFGYKCNHTSEHGEYNIEVMGAS
ncbi:MAG: helix-turn-helix transcriptional regulator [Bacteriovoracaceae bacterium]|nr:helix-turn-helix transcriptional regulator [Bacteriovoracaceae bacterium]